MQAGSIVCRGAYSKSEGYCCDANDSSSEYCNTAEDNPFAVNYEICTSDMNSSRQSSYALVCPFSEQICGASSQAEYVLRDTDQPSLISVTDARFVDGEVCQFELRADPEVLISDELNNYKIEVNITALQGTSVSL